MGGRGASSSYENESYTDYASDSSTVTDEAFRHDSERWQMEDEEYNAVRDYTGGYFRLFNEFLRQGTVRPGYTEEDVQKMVDNAEKGISKFNLSQNVLTHRYSSIDLLSGLGVKDYMPASQIAKMINDQKGSVVTDKGFTSTSTQHVWDGDIEYSIRVPRGTNAAYVRPISQHRSEFEIVLNKGTSFSILGASVKSNGKVRVDMEVYREGRQGRKRQVRNVGTRGNGETPLF